MGKIPRFFTRHTQPRANNADGTVSVYCRFCGREIVRAPKLQIRSVAKCAICVLKDQGVEDAEDYVLPQYQMPDPTKAPIPINYDDSIASGILMLYPDAELDATGHVPMSGGVVGTVKSIFKAIGFNFGPPPVEEVDQEHEPSKAIAVRKRKKGLYE